METAIDVVIDIHVRSEIQRLQGDIEQKSKQIASLLADGNSDAVTWTSPEFFAVKGNKKLKIKL